jgi:hypothetical protein
MGKRGKSRSHGQISDSWAHSCSRLALTAFFLCFGGVNPLLLNSTRAQNPENSARQSLDAPLRRAEGSIEDLRNLLLRYNTLRYQSGIGNRVVGWTVELFAGERTTFETLQRKVEQLQTRAQRVRTALAAGNHPNPEREIAGLLRSRENLAFEFQQFLDRVEVGTTRASITIGSIPVGVAAAGSCILAPAPSLAVIGSVGAHIGIIGAVGQLFQSLRPGVRARPNHPLPRSRQPPAPLSFRACLHRPYPPLLYRTRLPHPRDKQRSRAMNAIGPCIAHSLDTKRK